MTDYRLRGPHRIDTYNPGGSWVDEKNYNRTRKGGASGKVLCGNWQEEVTLEDDMQRNGHDCSIFRPKGRRITGGFESTAYLTSDKEPATRCADHLTTMDASYTAKNGDVIAAKKSNAPNHKLGVRSRIRAQMIVDEAKLLLSQQAEAQRSAQRPPSPESTYEATLSMRKQREGTRPRRPMDSQTTLNCEYFDETPVTLYTGNPRTGAKMIVPGKSEASGVLYPSMHAKNTTFSNDKFAIGPLNRKNL